MRQVEVFKTVDGKLFEDEELAVNHENDLIGQELDGLLLHVLKLDIERSRQFKALLNAIENKTELRKVVDRLHFLLEDEDYE